MSGNTDTESRTIALLGPYTSGKTTLLEAILFATGAIHRKGNAKENNTVGSIKARVTHAKSMGDEVSSYTSHPRATICIFIAKDDARLPIHSHRKSATSKALYILREGIDTKSTKR